MVRQTSIQAFREIRDSGVLSRQRWRVYRTLYRCGPATASEVYFKMNLGQTLQASIPSRLNELHKMGCVDEITKRKCSYTGKTCIVWDVNGKLPIPYKSPPTKTQIIKELRKKNRKLKRIIKKLQS